MTLLFHFHTQRRGVTDLERSGLTMMRTHLKLALRRSHALGTLLALLLCSAALVGCSTVRPELTEEEKTFNQQLKEQSSAGRLEWWQYGLIPLIYPVGLVGSLFSP
jgi:hypothetical protein